MAEQKNSKTKKIFIVFIVLMAIGFVAGACIHYFTSSENISFIDALYKDGYWR